jgi:hypothetical protein
MLFITKIKSCTDPKKTVYTILYDAVRKILQNIDSLKNPAINHQYYDMMVSTNNLLKGLLDVNTICTHNLINLVNRLWTVVNYLGSEIRMSQGSETNHMKNNLLYTNLQNEYFTVFLELNTLISREIEELQKAKYDERDICTAIAAAAVGDHIKHFHFCRGDCSAAGGGDGSDDDDDNVFFDIAGEHIPITVAPTPPPTPPPPTSSPPGACRKKIIPYDEAPAAAAPPAHEFSALFEEPPAAVKKQNMCFIM